MEVYKYLTDNYTRYLNELLAHIFEGSTEDDRDDLIATALKVDLKDAFLAEVVDLNGQLLTQMTKKMAEVRKGLQAVKGGTQVKHEHTEDGRIAKDDHGNDIVLEEARPGFAHQVLECEDHMIDDMHDVINEIKDWNKSAKTAADDEDNKANVWLDEATRNELAILSEFLSKGFAYHVDTTDFIAHTTHPYAPFSTGDYNELVDQINGFEQFFHYWKRVRERAVHTLATCKAVEKSAVSTQVFDVDIPALEKVADDLLLAATGAAEASRVGGEKRMHGSKDSDTSAREQLEGRVNKGKAKIFREIGFMVKKLYRATREEYKHSIREELEATITRFNEKLESAREEFEGMCEESLDAAKNKDADAREKFRQNWVDVQLEEFDKYDEETSPHTIALLEKFRDETMDAKIATARAEIEYGLTKKERDIKAAYEAVKLKISKIDDHHFQYNVRSLLEDAKAEADRRCAHDEHDAHELIDGIEEWVWDFVEESTERYNDKVKAEREALADGLNGAADRVWEEAADGQSILKEHQEHERHALEYFLKDCVKGLKHLFNRYGYVSPQFTEAHQHGAGYPHEHVVDQVDAHKLVASLATDPHDPDKHKDKNNDGHHDEYEDEVKSWKGSRSKSGNGDGKGEAECEGEECCWCICEGEDCCAAIGEGEECGEGEDFDPLACEGEGEDCEILCECPEEKLHLPEPSDESRSSCTGSSCDNPHIIDHNHDAIQLDSLEDLAHVIDDELIHEKDKHEHYAVEPKK